MPLALTYPLSSKAYSAFSRTSTKYKLVPQIMKYLQTSFVLSNVFYKLMDWKISLHTYVVCNIMKIQSHFKPLYDQIASKTFFNVTKIRHESYRLLDCVRVGIGGHICLLWRFWKTGRTPHNARSICLQFIGMPCAFLRALQLMHSLSHDAFIFFTTSISFSFKSDKIGSM